MTKEILEGFRKQYELELVKAEIEVRTLERENLIKADSEVGQMIQMGKRQVRLNKTRLDVIDSMLEEL